MIAVLANLIVVIIFARNGKIVKHALEIAVYAQMRPFVVTRHVMAKKPVAIALVIAEYVRLFAVMEHVKAQMEKTVGHALVIVDNVIQYVEMECANQMKIAYHVPKTVRAPALFHHVLKEKYEMIQTCV